ncbi:MBL fold metallo-hydrolase [Engelhardtia mirabilis]|uniref:Metal-dependent hydrolase n=1 Tax=Engelhardtia mirabilis TaxID=2528011 RepID=A0A518BMS4_9BACT|nr:metal-dependent hydrolase [Planctomycetes bacterium Pla133]QDV02601.1 metal-dependent hydrolase [Planctomycetes bacterium Pla86]
MLSPIFRRRLRRALTVLGAGVGLIAIAAVAGGWYFSGPRYAGPTSDHFDGDVFANAEATDHTDPLTVLRWMAGRDPGEFPARDLAGPTDLPPQRVEGAELRVQMVNHSTLLLQTAGLNLLTDPIWSRRSSPVQWAGPDRRTPAGIAFEDLPPIDAVLISHDHYDHLDRTTILRLRDGHDPLFVVPLGNRALLESWRVEKVVELDWWQSQVIGDLTIHATEVRHFSGRGLFDRNARLWCGYVIDGPGGATYFGGDSGYGEHYRRTAERLGPFRLALLPIGAYVPRWFMSPVHMDPADAVQAHGDLGAPLSIGIHFGTFQLADDARGEPLEDLRRALEAAGEGGIEGEFRTLENGAWSTVPPIPPADH